MWKEEKTLNLNLIVSFIIITALFFVGSARFLHLPDEQLKAGQWVTHTHEVLYQLEALSAELKQAEEDMRGYFFADAEHMTAYQADIENLSGIIGDLQRLTMDNAGQQHRLVPLQKDIRQYLDELEKIAEKGALTAEEKSDVSTSREDPKLTYRIDKQIEDMKAEEKRLLQIRMDDWHARSTATQKYFMAGAGALYMLVCVVLGSFYGMAIQRRKRIMTEQTAALLQKKKADHLEKIVGAQREIVGNTSNMQ